MSGIAALGQVPASVVGAREAATQGIAGISGHTAAHGSPVIAHSPNAKAATGFDRQPVAPHQAPQVTMAQAAHHATQAAPISRADHAPAAPVAPHAQQAAAVAAIYAAGRS